MSEIDTAAERVKLAALEGHTPGPWRKHGNGRHVTSDTDLVALAVAGPIKHNTRLIAVSPDLKATLAIALDEIDRLREALSKIASWDWHEIEPHGADIPENVEPWARELDNACTQMQRIARATLRNTETNHD